MKWKVGEDIFERCEECSGTGWKRAGIDPVLGPLLDCHHDCPRCKGAGCVTRLAGHHGRDDQDKIKVRSGKPNSFGWLRRKDLETGKHQVWERPDGTLYVFSDARKPFLHQWVGKRDA